MSKEENLEQDQQALDIKDIAKEANQLIGGLRRIKADVKNKLGDIEVSYDPLTSPELSKAMKEIFGEEFASKVETNKKAVSFDSYITCLNIVKLAGKAKAEDFIKDKIF